MAINLYQGCKLSAIMPDIRNLKRKKKNISKDKYILYKSIKFG